MKSYLFSHLMDNVQINFFLDVSITHRPFRDSLSISSYYGTFNCVSFNSLGDENIERRNIITLLSEELKLYLSIWLLVASKLEIFLKSQWLLLLFSVIMLITDVDSLLV